MDPKTDLINIQARYKVHYFQAWLLPSYHIGISQYAISCMQACVVIFLGQLSDGNICIAYSIRKFLIAHVRYKTCAAISDG